MSASKEVHRLIRKVGSLSDGQASIEGVNWENGNIQTFKIVLKPNSGYFNGGTFEFQVYLDDQYPSTSKPPVVKCLTDIYHPNIHSCDDSYIRSWYNNNNNVCLNLLDTGTWDPAFGLESIVLGLLFLLNNPNQDSILHETLFPDDDFENNVKRYMRGECVEGRYFDAKFFDNESEDLQSSEASATRGSSRDTPYDTSPSTSCDVGAMNMMCDDQGQQDPDDKPQHNNYVEESVSNQSSIVMKLFSVDGETVLMNGSFERTCEKTDHSENSNEMDTSEMETECEDKATEHLTLNKKYLTLFDQRIKLVKHTSMYYNNTNRHNATASADRQPDISTNGLHVESHGIVGNFMYDEETGGVFELGETPRSLDPHWWKGAEAFYISAEKQGIKTALYDWRGCQVERDGWSPSFCKPFTSLPTMQDSRNAMYNGLKRLKSGDTDIVYVYHEQVDHQGHMHGPDSDVVRQTLQDLDTDIDELLDNITALGLDDINIILVSDHGMTSIGEDNTLDIVKAIDVDDIIKMTEGGTQTYIWPVKTKEQKVYNDLRRYSDKYDVYYRTEIADDWFLKKHRLMSPILVVAKPGWFVQMPERKKFVDKPPKGNHGFENKEEHMRSIFVAAGPDFKKSHIAPPFKNVNVYQVVCHVTGVRPRPHNGTWSDVRDMLINPEPLWKDNGPDIVTETHSEL